MSSIVQVAPAGLEREQAAAYVGLSISTFEKAVRERNAPQPRQIAKRRVVWRRAELDAWLEKCPVSEQLPPENTDEGGKRSRRGSRFTEKPASPSEPQPA